MAWRSIHSVCVGGRRIQWPGGQDAVPRGGGGGQDTVARTGEGLEKAERMPGQNCRGHLGNAS